MPAAARRLSAAALTAWLLLSPTGLVFAGPVADAQSPAGQRPTVTTAPTGVPMVDIAAPNAAGASYNRYQRFDVDPAGLLLNNSTTPQLSALGVAIPANGNLHGRSAGLIVNEVVTAIPSQLNGPVGVLGDPAKVVIANPNGITCNGCSFLNTAHVTLTTGTISWRDGLGAPTAFGSAATVALEVAGGRVEIQGAGLSSPLDRLDLIAQTLRIDAPVTIAGALNLLAGRQTVDAASLAVLAPGADNTRAAIGEDWAVDATAFGALNAGSIRILATAAGMGVRAAAGLAASSGDLVIDSNGDLSLRGAGASGNASLAAAGALTNGGALTAGGNLSITAASLDNRQGLISAAAGSLSLTTPADLDNTGGTLAAARDATLRTAGLANAGGLIASYGGTLDLVATGAFDNAAGLVAAAGNLSLGAASLANTGGILQAGNELALTLTGGGLDLSGATAGTLAAADRMAIRAVSLANSGSFSHAGGLTLAADGQFTNTGTLAAGGRLSLAAGTTLLNTGVLVAVGELAATAAALDNAGQVVAGGAGSFSVSSSFTNRAAGTLDVGGAFALAAPAAAFANDGWIAAAGNADLTAASMANAGTLAAGGRLDAAIGGSLANSGTLASGGDMALGAASFSNTGTVDSGAGLNLTAPAFANSGRIAAQGNLTLAAATSFANSGSIATALDAAFTLGAVAGNAGGLLFAGNDLSLSTAVVGNLGGSVGANRDLRLTFTDYTHGAGQTDFLAGRDLTVAAHDFTNQGGLAAWRNLGLATTGALTNTGSLAAGQDMSLAVAATLTNTGTVEAGRDLTLAAAAIANGGAGTSTFSRSGGSFADYRNWVLTYIADPLIQAKLFNEIPPDWQSYNSRFYLLNRWAYFMDSGLSGPVSSLTLTTHGAGGVLSAGRHLGATASTSFANHAALVTAGGELSLTAPTFANSAGIDTYDGDVFAGGGGHRLIAYGQSAATVQAGGTLTIAAGSSTNTGTLTGNSVWLGGSLVNGLTNYNQPTPATTLPQASIDLAAYAPPAAPAAPPAPAAPAAPTPAAAPVLPDSAARLALLAPVAQDTLLALLPAELRPGAPVFALDAWQEQQALRQAALKETGQALFLAGLAYDAGSGLSAESRQRLLLYQATARFATGQGIRLGVALSAEQQQKLAEPLLWYVEQTATGPDGQTYTALAPRLYLPEGSREALANVAGGLIRGTDVTLAAGAGSVENTGYVVAEDTLTLTAGTLANRARSAAWGRYTQNVDGGYVEVWGDRVQPGGFLSAARLELDAQRIESLSGAFLEGGADQAARLEQALGAAFARSENIDRTFTQFRAKRSGGLLQALALVVAVAVALYTAGAASGAIASAAGESAAAAAAAAGASEAAVAGAYASASAASAASWSTAAISGAAGAMAGNVGAQLLTTGSLDAGQMLRSGLSGAISGGVAGYYGATYGLERVAAETVAGCASAAVMGGECGEGAKSAFVTASLAWANREMRDAMIAESKKFPGVCDANGKCLDNKSGSSVGVNGDNFKLAGGRVDLAKLCDDDRCKIDSVTGDWARDGEGRVVMNPADKYGNPVNLISLLDANPDWRSTMGGWQGRLGKFAVFNYQPGSVWDRIAEAYAGPHDTLNRAIWYDPLGNIKTGVAESLLGRIGDITNYTNVLLATPFALGTLLPPGTLQAIRAGARDEREQR